MTIMESIGSGEPTSALRHLVVAGAAGVPVLFGMPDLVEGLAAETDSPVDALIADRDKDRAR